MEREASVTAKNINDKYLFRSANANIKEQRIKRSQIFISCSMDFSNT